MTDEPVLRRRDRVATRAALLDAARIRFARHGFAATRIRDVAADAGVDAALVHRYFGSKDSLYAEALHVEIPARRSGDPHRPIAHIADELVREVVFGDWPEFGGEHPMVAMLRSAGHAGVRDDLRDRLCRDHLGEFTERLRGPDAALRAEVVGALLVGLGVLRTVLGTPALSGADQDRTRAIVADMVRAVTRHES